VSILCRTKIWFIYKIFIHNINHCAVPRGVLCSKISYLLLFDQINLEGLLYSCTLKFIGIIIGHINWTLFDDQKQRDVTSFANFSPGLLSDVLHITSSSIFYIQFCGPHLITRIKYYRRWLWVSTNKLFFHRRVSLLYENSRSGILL